MPPVKSQPHLIQHPKPITTTTLPATSKGTAAASPTFYPPATGTAFKTMPAHSYSSKDPKPIKASPLSSPIKVKRNVKFDTADSTDEGSTTDEPLMRYQTDNGSIYTVPSIRRNTTRGTTTTDKTWPRPRDRGYHMHSDGQSITSESASEGTSHSSKTRTSFKSKKAMFEQFSNLPPAPVKANSLKHQTEGKPMLRRYKSSEALPEIGCSQSPFSPPTPPPVPPRHITPKTHPPSNMPLSFSSPNLFQADDDDGSCEAPTKLVRPTVMDADPSSFQVQGTKLLGWGGHGPTIAVPTAILAAMKLKEQDALGGMASDDFSDLSDQYNRDDALSSRLAIPTAILAGPPPIPPVRVESSQCSPLRKRSFIYDSSNSSVTDLKGLCGNGTERKGSIMSYNTSTSEEDEFGIQQTRSNSAMSRLKGILGFK